ncbi:hypothetical protein [uncultured Jatrophihabitans sp.]|uniref:putative alpha/beta hydrolase n=1 Tax=uncultured Jatrophihabitans sp. TaxID=1610747 RepID=UPI0035CBC3CC
MTLISNDELAARAGVNPWDLNAKLAVGDPAQVGSLAAAFYKASGDMTSYNTEQRAVKRYVSEGYKVDGTTPVDFDKQARSTAGTPDTLRQIGKVLDAVGTHLDTAMRKTDAELTALQGTLASVDRQWTSFMQSIGHHLPPDDQEAVRQEYIDQAVAATKSHGTAMDHLITGYEETVYRAQRSMSDLGYVPPASLDDEYGDAATYVKGLQAKARAAADKLRNNHELDGSWAKDAHNVANEVKPYLNDPYFAAAFYGRLGPQEAQMMPSLLYQSGSKTGAGDLAVYSHLLGTAVTNRGDDAGMAAVADVFLTKPVVGTVSADRAAMVSHGDFPPDWLAQAARVNALDDFAKHGAQGANGMGFDEFGPESRALGLPGNIVAAWTQDLGQNPQAAREALATMGSDRNDVHIYGDPSAAYQSNVHKLIAYGKSEGYPGDVGRGYGAAFEAAAGADDEHDGDHSAAAAGFAHALFDDLQHDGGDVQPVAATNFAKISGSYVQEMAAGAAQNADAGPGFTIPGTHPAFALSPDETRNVMKTFVGDADATNQFDNAAGTQMHAAQVAAARLDARSPSSDANHLERTSSAFGSVAGVENSTTREIVGERDESAAHQSELIRSVISAGVDLIPGDKLVEGVPSTAWDIAKHVTNMGLEATFGATDDPRFDALTNTSHAMAVTGAYDQLSVLREAGYPGTQNVPSVLIDPSTGNLLPAGKVLSDPTLQTALHSYMRQQAQQHGPDTTSVYDEANRSTNGYQGGFDHQDEH